MIQWGINALNHGSSLAVFKDGELKLWETSKDDELPSEHIRSALNWGSPDKIYWYENPWLKKARQIRAGQYSTAFKLSNLPKSYLRRARLSYAPVTYTQHHASHAAAGYYTSPFNHCAIVVLDAIGEFESATIWEGKHGEMRKLWSAKYPNSLGLFYSAFAQLLGLTPIKDEHILQQMAAQGKPDRYRSTVGDYFDIGAVSLTYNFHKGVQNWTTPFKDLQDQCDLAAAVQERFEMQVASVMYRAKDLTGSNCLVYMGGCAMNSDANAREVDRQFQFVWSLPNPGDPSSAIGAVAYHNKNRIWNWQWQDCKHIKIKV